jgi:hypothetical protein
VDNLLQRLRDAIDEKYPIRGHATGELLRDALAALSAAEAREPVERRLRTTLDDIIVELLRESHAASTQGEWSSMPFYGAPHYICCPHEGERRVLLSFNHHFDSAADWLFITSVHKYLPTILDRLEIAEARVKELESKHG